MSTKRILMATLAVVTTLAASAGAQKNELAGVVGRTFISDQGVTSPVTDTLRFGNGFTFQVNYGRHLMGEGLTQLFFEVPASFNLDEDLHMNSNVIPEKYKAIFVTPSARANFFASTRVSPWASFGGGYGRFSASSNLEFGGTYTGQKSTNTGVLQLGAGLDVKVFSRFSVRGEFRDFWSGTPNLGVQTGKSRQHNFFVGAGVVWHFGK